MFENWGFGEWFYVIWLSCYAITYIKVLMDDFDIDKAVGQMFVCGLFWPFFWFAWIINSDFVRKRR